MCESRVMEARSPEMSLVIALHQFQIFAQHFEVRNTCSICTEPSLLRRIISVQARFIISIVDVRNCDEYVCSVCDLNKYYRGLEMIGTTR